MDVKQDGIGPAIAKVLREVGMPFDQTYMTSGSDERSDALVEALPGILMVRTGPIPESWDSSFFDHWRTRGRRGFMAAFREDGLTEAFVEDAQAHGMFIVTRFARSKEDLQRTIDAGADGALTLEIERLVSFLPMPGDTNGDHSVDEADLEVLRANWHSRVSGGASDGDFDRNSVVDEADMQIILRKWGTVARDRIPTNFIVFPLIGAAGLLVLLAYVVWRNRANSEQ